jgi:hypothetical protein
MTDQERKAMEMALQALCSANPIGHALEDYTYHNKATEALRQALAQPDEIKSAVLAEREACAKLCESPIAAQYGKALANAIRARGDKHD